MVIISDYSENDKNNDITIITSNKTLYCPICGCELRSHGRCMRKGIFSNEVRLFSLEVLYCPKCRRSHRAIPDKIIPYKRHCAETYADIYDAVEMTDTDVNMSIDDRTIYRIRKWIRDFFKYSSNLIEYIRTVYGMEFLPCNNSDTISMLKGFVRIIVNSNLWTFSVTPVHPS